MAMTDTDYFFVIVLLFALMPIGMTAVGEISDETVDLEEDEFFDLEERIDFIEYEITTPEGDIYSFSTFNTTSVDIVEGNETILTFGVDLEDDSYFTLQTYNYETPTPFIIFEDNIEVESTINLNTDDVITDSYPINIESGNENVLTHRTFRNSILWIEMDVNSQSLFYYDEYYNIGDSRQVWYESIPFIGLIISFVIGFTGSFIVGVSVLPAWFNALYFGTWVSMGTWIVLRLFRGN